MPKGDKWCSASPRCVAYTSCCHFCSSSLLTLPIVRCMANLDSFPAGLPSVLVGSVSICSRPLGVLAVLRQSAVLLMVVSYNAAISACVNGRQYKKPVVLSCSAAVSACGRCLQGQRAFGVLAVLQLTAILPSVISYIAAISAWKGQKWQEALVS